MKKITKKYRILNILKLFMLLCFCILMCAYVSGHSTISAVEDWSYINDLAGTFTIQSADAKYGGKEFDIYGGNTSATDNTAPPVIIYESDSVPKANHRFSFIPLELNGGKMIYSITSAIDNAGCLDVQNGVFSNNQPIWFWKKSNNNEVNKAQRWYVKTSDSGKTVRIELVADERFSIGISTSKINGHNKICLSNSFGNSTKWKLMPIAGEFGLNTKTYIMDDNTGYNSTQNELSRYLSPLDNSAESRISDIISVGVHGEGTQKIEKTKYNNVTAFRVPYSSKFFIDTSFNYANLIYEDWTQNLPLGKMSNSGGSILNWMVSDDSYSIKTTSDNAEHSVGTGACIIELSTDNQEWDKYRLFKFTSKKGNDIWELDGKRISKGVYVRVSYLWEIYTHWTTFERDWYNYLLFGIPIGGHNVDHYEHKNVMEISDSFYVGVDGFSQGNDFGVISIENLTESENSKYECEGFSYEELKKAETLTDGSQTNTGFKIESLYSSETYKIEVSKNGGRFLEVFSGYSSTDSGRYQIRATSKFGTQKTITIYVCSGDITENYFGEVFASKPYETSLVQGTRLFAGSNDYLKNVGINITYGWSQFPVFVNGATINIKDTSNLASLIGSITYNGLDGEKAIEVPCQKSSVSIRLKESGFYTVNLSTENSNGDITHFSANFWVVENVIGPEINKQLLTLISHESYDLIPVYYSVDMPRGPYTYIDETGKEIEKQGILRYAFSTYNSALDFSLRLEKEYTHYLGNGMFRYLNSNSPNIFLNEFELFDEMYQNAKVKVKKNYFSATNKLSMVGIDKKGIISDRGYVYYLGEESFDGNPQNAAPIVALNKSERDALTSRQNFLNNFIFISMPLDSAMVRLVSSEGKEYFIKYDIPVGEQLRAAGAKTDIYTVIETSIFGIETKYTGVYIDESEANSITINLMLDSKLKVITSEQSNIILKCKDGFTLESASDLFDKHGLICVTYNRCETPLDIATLSNVRFEQVGTYSIKVEDRFGRIYIFTIIVE